MKKVKDAGNMIGDREVLAVLLRQLLKPEYRDGVILDGFPRTKVQVECLKMLYEKMTQLWREFYGTPLAIHFRQPVIQIVGLFIDEKESVARQLKRGRETKAHNEEVRRTGHGKLLEERATDFDEKLARRRYRVFKEQTWDALLSLKDIFHYHLINAQGTIAEVEQNILEELEYQSSLELDPRTFDRLRTLPLASEIVVHARQELVKRPRRLRAEPPRAVPARRHPDREKDDADRDAARPLRPRQHQQRGPGPRRVRRPGHADRHLFRARLPRRGGRAPHRDPRVGRPGDRQDHLPREEGLPHHHPLQGLRDPPRLSAFGRPCLARLPGGLARPPYSGYLPHPAHASPCQPRPPRPPRKRAVPRCFFLAAVLLVGGVAAGGPRPSVGAPGQKPEPLSDQIMLRDESIDQVLVLLERWTGRTILRPQTMPTATITLSLRESVTKAEAIQAVETLLNLNGIAVTPLGTRFLKATPLNLAKSEAPEFIEGSTLNLTPSGRIASKLFQMTFLRIGEFMPQIAGLLNPATGSPPVIFEKNNSALITDSVSNLQRVESLIARLDQPLLAGLQPKFYQLSNVKASDLVNKLRTLFTGPLQTQLGTATTYNADDRTNQVILMSDPRQYAFFDELIAKLDVKSDSNNRNEVIYLKHATAKDVASVLSQLVSGQTAAAKANGQETLNRPGQTATAQPGGPMPQVSLPGLGLSPEGSESIQRQHHHSSRGTDQRHRRFRQP